MTTEANIRPPDPVQWSEYSDRGAGKPLPPKAEYTLTPTELTFGRTKEGYLQVVVDALIQAPGTPYDGYLTRFNRFNTKNWPNKETSGFADYLAGFGITGMATDQEYEAAARATLNRPFTSVCDWEIYDSASGYSLKGYDNFPTDATGKKLSRVEHKGSTLFANVRIKYVRSAVKKAA